MNFFARDNFPELVNLSDSEHDALSARVDALRQQIQVDYPDTELPNIYILRAGNYSDGLTAAITRINSAANDFTTSLFPDMAEDLEEQNQVAIRNMQILGLNGFAGRTPWMERDVIIIPELILNVLSEEEVASVIAHEYGHIIQGHTERQFDWNLSRLVQTMRGQELDADSFAARYGYGEPLISTLQTLSSMREEFLLLNILGNDGVHPPVPERVEHIREVDSGLFDSPPRIESLSHSRERE
jgi:Zn-dependent protease with chaperone function